MVGRILADLKRRGVLHEAPKPAVLRPARRKLRNRPWAIRKPKHWRIEQPGDLAEIDTKDIAMRRGVVLKHFSARDVISRWDIYNCVRPHQSLAYLHPWNLSHAGKRTSERQSVTNLLDEYTFLRIWRSASTLNCSQIHYNFDWGPPLQCC
jgi:hypothetical protein